MAQPGSRTLKERWEDIQSRLDSLAGEITHELDEHNDGPDIESTISTLASIQHQLTLLAVTEALGERWQ